MIWILGLIAFFALGGPAWALKKINDTKKADQDWADALAKDRATHQAETAALKAKVELLEKAAFPPRP